jgi:hypothetical protein
MKYTITLYNKFNRPYIYNDSSTTCISIDSTSYETTDLKLCKTIIKDFLDVPEAELSLDEVKKQFDDPRYNISEEKLVAIQNYYNGRLALFKTIMFEIDDLNNGIYTYDIPYEYNHFVIEDDEEYKEKQINAYIELKVDNND